MIGAIRVTVAETADSVRRFLEDFRFGPTVVQQSATYEVKLLEQIEIKAGQIFVQLIKAHTQKNRYEEKMATAAEPNVKEKKKNRLRSRFLAAQASSLDSVTPVSGTHKETVLIRHKMNKKQTPSWNNRCSRPGWGSISNHNKFRVQSF